MRRKLPSIFELKKKKKEQHELAKRGQEPFTRHLEWYEEGKERSLALRQQEEMTKMEVPLVIPKNEPSPDNICIRLYNEGKNKVLALREKEKEKEAKIEVVSRLTVPVIDPSPNHTCNRLYEECREQKLSLGKVKRKAFRMTSVELNPKYLPKYNHKSHQPPMKVDEGLYRKKQFLFETIPNEEFTIQTSSVSFDSSKENYKGMT